MNKIFKLFSLLAIVAMMFASCSPEDYALGAKSVKPSDLVEGLAFKIEHDTKNPNIVYLTSLMGSEYTPLWNHPQGRSQEQKVTLKIPFAGTYKVQFGVQTRGGAVYGDTVSFKVDNMYADFVSDELWTLLSGGSGNEKTWYLDLDANSVSRYFQGPLYFYGTNDSWESVTNGVKVGGDSWNWSPDYKGNSWLMTAADFGSMTFNLKGGANVIVNHKTISTLGVNGTQTGKYMIDTQNHTMKMQDAGILHDTGRNGVVINWGDVKILSLTKNTMQLAVNRDPTLSGEGPCLLVYNFISKDYFDSWVAPVTVEPEPKLPDGWQSDVSQTVSKSVKWVLSSETPFNWANLDGSLMNTAWTAADKYDSWTGFNAAAAASYAKFSLTLNSETNAVTYVAPDGTSTAGTYSLDAKGNYTFTGVSPNFVICGGWVTLATTATNQWRITKIEKDASGTITGMWVGKRDAVKAEYMVYHLIPQMGTAVADPLAAWKKALIGKTFKPDTNWFIDWMKYDFTGGWTSATTFATDFTSNSWVWTSKTSDIAKSASLKFEASGSDIKATLTQDVYDAAGTLVTAGYSVSGKVTINPDIPSIAFEFPLVNYTGSPGAWLNTTNAKGSNWAKPLGLNEWLYLPYGSASLATISTNGFWLGCIANSVAGGDTKDEILGFHFVMAN